MRLINANALAEVLVRHENDGRLLLEYEYGVNSGLEIAEMEIDEAPTVEAIPVEWIKKYMSRCLAIEQDAIGEMVKEWAERKEE